MCYRAASELSVIRKKGFEKAEEMNENFQARIMRCFRENEKENENVR